VWLTSLGKAENMHIKDLFHPSKEQMRLFLTLRSEIPHIRHDVMIISLFL
jgi:hypothetical protein